VIAGIITASHQAIGSVKVATVNLTSRPVGGINPEKIQAEALGDLIADTIERTGANFVVAPESLLDSTREYTCEDYLTETIYPKISGMNAYVTVGCTHWHRQDECWIDNMSYTMDPNGAIVNVYGKSKPIPGEMSCYRPGVSVTPARLNVDKINFSSVICYDADYSGPIATAADGGASLILNPSSDWSQVRHHYAVAVIRAIENRVAIVKAEYNYDAAIIDPFGRVVALGHDRRTNNLFGEVSISSPLKIGWVRQQMAYWVFIAIYVITMSLDIYKYTKRRKHK
jgi:apolipoprotein N-acyltransferase